jgi:hypothetical protein
MSNSRESNTAKEPKTYPAEYPSPEQQRRYWILGGITTLFMIGALALAVAVS